MAARTAMAAVGAALVAAAGVRAEWTVITNAIELAMGVGANDDGVIIMTGSQDSTHAADLATRGPGWPLPLMEQRPA